MKTKSVLMNLGNRYDNDLGKQKAPQKTASAF
jgi:hypothetical protein